MRTLANRLSSFLLAFSIIVIFVPGKAHAQMCVHYARSLTNFDIQGDAWLWWQHAAGHYQRGIRPAVGSVLVFRRTGHMGYGHVAVVSRIVDRRTVLVDHSWFDDNVLYRGMKVVDTSPNNSWSSVRVWNAPSDSLGQRTYPTYGFIYPHGGRGIDQPLSVAEDNGDNGVVSSHPHARTPAKPIQVASILVTPRHKPGIGHDHAIADSPQDASQAIRPRHKPSVHVSAQVAELHGHGSAAETDE